MSIDAQILSALRQAGDGSVSGADLAQQLGVSRAAIWARIEELRQLGYEIEAGPHIGYRLRSSPDALHADDLTARLGRTRVIGRDIRVFEQTTSTNDIVEKLARDGVPEGVAVFAEAQTRGRGRLGRQWISPARQGIWCSVLLRPDLRPQQATQLTVAAAASLVAAIRSQTGLKPEIKWPNDILVNGRKLAGILTELSAELDHIRYVILGIGVDVNVEAEAFPADLRRTATSLAIETGERVSRPELAVAILRELDRNYRRIAAGEFEGVADEWEASCTTIGREVTIRIGDRRVRGRAESLGEDGALLLRTEHGRIEPITGGDVTLEK
ncbi:MAG TPA: biotin--[acetyl-CoA-carboxylase] ligase [Verrucomicrobia bacterium]|nr:biotin--[acetyl-CoA-carboxylase] ligase [Verrucomicrobiota bacterium]HOB31773.1 biotin--[acetyl-CoA-carboxylase] ligase [Verrucomicrobiota bacterium]HOP97227.1 biotin--[acetyl-CoA-carboxylase] ligase [Verrucomicrobiota bacterium]HPU55693.1 biotin--[acetyl-CoA-carboxylase] ligase [Verrucomicrobiota bacterium]